MDQSFLPIKQYKKQILYAVDKNDITIITAETGSGKTTQIPQFLIQAGYTLNDKKIAVVLPRRIAAVSLAKRVSQELGCFNGEIASNVRFNSTVNQNTRVVYMTDGILVQQLYSDPLLRQYSLIMLDDIHQRSINFEILFGFLKKIISKSRYGQLKLVVTSATLESQKIKHFFEKKFNYKSQSQPELKIACMNIVGRLHQVNIHFLKQASKNYFLKIFQTIIYIDRQKDKGDVLVFLPSVQEIQGLTNMLDSYCIENKRSLKVLQCHAGLSIQAQGKIFQYCFQRKIILCTNICESSVTIPGIKFVIDCGLVKVKAFDSDSGIEKMIVVSCGKSGANQRAGRAGRISNGQCFRIYTEDAFLKMPIRVPPQIMRINLANFILKLKGLGIVDITKFQLMENPQQYSLIKAIDTLYAYSLINTDFQLTEKGRLASQFSLDIRLASMLLDSFDPRFGCSQQILILVSMLQVERDLFTGSGLSILKSKKKIGAKEGDFITLINIFLRYTRSKNQEKKRICGEFKVSHNTMQKAVKIHQQLLSQIKDFNRYKSQLEEMEDKFGQNKKRKLQIKSSNDDYQPILRCILMGFFTNIAQFQGDGTYLNIQSKQKIQIHSTSVLSVVYPQWIIYYQIVKSNNYYIYNGSKIQADWIFELAGHYYHDQRKTQIAESYAKEQEIERVQTSRKTEEKSLVKVGGIKKKPQMFKTSVLGLKGNKKSNLSFEEDF